MENTSDYRVGSPFASEPPAVLGDNAVASADLQDHESPGAVLPPADPLSAPSEDSLVAILPEALGEGVWGQTAAAAAYSAVILLAFATACWLIFPGGGVAVAALGALVSLMGLSSKRVRLSTATLMLHGVLFFACYLSAI